MRAANDCAADLAGSRGADTTGTTSPHRTSEPPARRRFLVYAFTLGILRPEHLRDAIVRELDENAS